MTTGELRIARSSPVVRKIAAEFSVDINDVPGTGLGGRVTREDILAYVETRKAALIRKPDAEVQQLSVALPRPAAAAFAVMVPDSPAPTQVVPPAPPVVVAPPPPPPPVVVMAPPVETVLPPVVTSIVPPSAPAPRPAPVEAAPVAVPVVPQIAPPPPPVLRAPVVPPVPVVPPTPPVPVPPATAAASSTAAPRVERVPMSPIRKKTAEHMLMSKRTSAHVSTVWEIDMSRIAMLRDKYKKSYNDRSGVKLTYTPFIVKAATDALKAFPVLNSSVDGDAIAYRKDVNIGMAVALDWGLIVPVISNADEKNVLGLAKAVNDLGERARTKKLKVEEVQGGTFTITNPGVFGSLFGTPIINQPQVAILGVGTIEKRPVVRDDAIAIRTMAYFCLTFDHRIVDGADADKFMAHLKNGLQNFDESAL